VLARPTPPSYCLYVYRCGQCKGWCLRAAVVMMLLAADRSLRLLRGCFELLLQNAIGVVEYGNCMEIPFPTCPPRYCTAPASGREQLRPQSTNVDPSAHPSARHTAVRRRTAAAIYPAPPIQPQQLPAHGMWLFVALPSRRFNIQCVF